MRRFLFLIVILVIGTAALGFYLNWFSLGTTTTDDGKKNITVTVDKDKIKADEKKAADKLKELGHDAKDKAKETIEKVK